MKKNVERRYLYEEDYIYTKRRARGYEHAIADKNKQKTKNIYILEY